MDYITIIVYLLLGITSSVVSYIFLKDLINSPGLLKENYANNSIASIGGLVPLVSLFIAQAIDSLFSDTHSRTEFAQSALIITLGYALIGLLDDLAGDKSSQGFKGHIKALIKGKVTTGSIKLFGGPVIAFFVFVPGIQSRGIAPVIIDSLCVALIANTFNLLDLSPGRATKYMLIFAVTIFALNTNRDFLLVLIGVLIITFILDVREKLMLGDVGANLFGALLGFYYVSEVSDRTTLFSLGVLVLVNLLSEFVSFSKIINAVWPLRKFDELGQTKERVQWNKARRSAS